MPGNNDLILIGLFGAVAVGAMFYIGRRDKLQDTLQPNTGALVPLPGGVPTPRTDPNTGYTYFYPSAPGTPLQFSPFNPGTILSNPKYYGEYWNPGQKVGLPITGGSRGYDNPNKFTTQAQGTCQCDDRECCYQAPYQPERGDLRTKTACATIRYGDKPTACQEALRQYTNKTFVARMYATRAMTASTARYQAHRLARSRLSRTGIAN